jgi:hypothetical protein
VIDLTPEICCEEKIASYNHIHEQHTNVLLLSYVGTSSALKELEIFQ